MSETPVNITITESYGSYCPPVHVRRIVRRMIDLTPPEYLTGLRTIVLRDSASLNHNRRRAKTRSRKRRVAQRECRGLYHQKCGDEPAWIEIFVDNMLAPYPRLMLLIPPLRDEVIGLTLFHEIGHHIHQTKAPEHKEKEDVADKWKNRLTRSYYPKRYWYLAVPLKPLAFILRRIIPKRHWTAAQKL